MTSFIADESGSPPGSSASATAAAPFSRLPHRYDTQPTSLYATHTYVDPNLDLSAAAVGDGNSASNSVNDDLIAQLKTLLRLRLEEEEQEGSKVRKKEISEVGETQKKCHPFRQSVIGHFVTR